MFECPAMAFRKVWDLEVRVCGSHGIRTHTGNNWMRPVVEMHLLGVGQKNGLSTLCICK